MDSQFAVPGAPTAELWRQAVHDLRGRLAVVTLVTAQLHKPVTEARRLELLGVLDRNVAGLRALLNVAADQARLSAGHEAVVLCRIDMATALRDMCDSLRIMASSRGLRLRISGPASLMAESDPLMLGRITQNLMLNAIQYTRGADVMLSYGLCDADAGRWYIEVVDAGGDPGTDSALASLCGPGMAVAAPTPGEGIGLSIVRRLCQQLGGTMRIESTAGSGRITRIDLPVRHGVGLEFPRLASAAGRVISSPCLHAPTAPA
ncbi:MULTISPECIES: HAMP domain-containing sensor histidine kinase [Roseateles]|uniref:histidine kinase n=1 Tax=Pelomonas aquatica TaxID=431058 RepID=A0ABU1Z5I9_9BURK|nr:MULTISPECIES: HAMP domain-containing sensor histidine kinase [Roseateles]MDR7295889.1 two-component system CheB/CheR fusion protein [Pelomonas aquatica]